MWSCTRRLAGVDVLGLDETAFQASATQPTPFVTGIVDLSVREPSTISSPTSTEF
jgi:hypothetical protein